MNHEINFKMYIYFVKLLHILLSKMCVHLYKILLKYLIIDYTSNTLTCNNCIVMYCIINFT